MKNLKLFVLFLLLFLLPIFYVFLDSYFHPRSVKIAVGLKHERYYDYAMSYREELKKEGVKLEIIETKGSVEAQQLLMDKKVDFSFVQSGTENTEAYALANIAYEPIWIFYRGETVKKLGYLKGKRIAISEQGSGILPLSLELLSVVGVHGFNSRFKYLPNDKAAEALKAGKIDAMFYIASSKTPLLNKLMYMSGIKLMSFNNAESYKQYFSRKNRYFEILKLKRGGFDLRRNIPSSEHKLLAKTAILATNDKPSDSMVRLLLKVVNRVHSHKGIFKEENTFPNVSFLKMPQHKASKHYFRNKKHYYEEHYSFWLAQSLNKLQNFAFKYILPLVTLFAFIIEVVIPTAHLYSRKKIGKWYNLVNKIDSEIESLDLTQSKNKRNVLQKILEEIRGTDDIPVAHMELFYTLQNQIVNLIDALEKRIENLEHRTYNKF